MLRPNLFLEDLMKKILSLFAASVVLSAGAFAADLTVDAKFDLNGKDAAGSYLTFKSAIVSVEKDQVDVVTGASKAEGTDKWNYLRPDVKGKATFPAGFQSLVKYPVSPESQYTADLPKAWKNADGSITFQYLHRGTAYLLTTDAAGKLAFPTGNYKVRKIGYIDTKGVNFISTDFSKDGTVAGIDWKKVWDDKVASGTVINGQAKQLTGPVAEDKPASEIYVWEGALQATLTGTVVTVKGELNAKLLK